VANGWVHTHGHSLAAAVLEDVLGGLAGALAVVLNLGLAEGVEGLEVVVLVRVGGVVALDVLEHGELLGKRVLVLEGRGGVGHDHDSRDERRAGNERRHNSRTRHARVATENRTDLEVKWFVNEHGVVFESRNT
jgi:hypothetical protein